MFRYDTAIAVIGIGTKNLSADDEQTRGEEKSRRGSGGSGGGVCGGVVLLPLRGGEPRRSRRVQGSRGGLQESVETKQTAAFYDDETARFACGRESEHRAR